jgi:hypothetical protein
MEQMTLVDWVGLLSIAVGVIAGFNYYMGERNIKRMDRARTQLRVAANQALQELLKSQTTLKEKREAYEKSKRDFESTVDSIKYSDGDGDPGPKSVS